MVLTEAQARLFWILAQDGAIHLLQQEPPMPGMAATLLVPLPGGQAYVRACFQIFPGAPPAPPEGPLEWKGELP